MLFESKHVLKSHAVVGNNSIVSLFSRGKGEISTSNNKEHKEIVLALAQEAMVPRHHE